MMKPPLKTSKDHNQDKEKTSNRVTKHQGKHKTLITEKSKSSIKICFKNSIIWSLKIFTLTTRLLTRCFTCAIFEGPQCRTAVLHC